MPKVGGKMFGYGAAGMAAAKKEAAKTGKPMKMTKMAKPAAKPMAKGKK